MHNIYFCTNYFYNIKERKNEQDMNLQKNQYPFVAETGSDLNATLEWVKWKIGEPELYRTNNSVDLKFLTYKGNKYLKTVSHGS